MAVNKDELENLAGFLNVKQHHKAFRKFRPSRKKFWCVLDESAIKLNFFKSPKDSLLKAPSGTIELQGASFYFENADSFEFIINVAGKEHLFRAESHGDMMVWLRRLRDKVYSEDSFNLLGKRTKSLDFDTIKDEESFFQKPVQFSMSCNNLTESPSKAGTRARRRNFWNFRRSTSNSSEVKLKAGPSSLRNGGASAEFLFDGANRTYSLPQQSSGSTGKKWKCKSCASLASENDSLNDRVRSLTERLESTEKEAGDYSSALKRLKLENLELKTNLVSITQDMVAQEEENDANLEFNRHCDKIIDMLETARVVNSKLPDYKSATSTIYTDSLGFIHGTRESPAQAFQHCCEQLKQYYAAEAKEEDLLVKWQALMDKSDDLDLSHEDLRSLILEGVPQNFRQELWTRLISNKVKSIKEDKGEGYYEKLARLIPDIEDVDNEFDDSIEKQIRIDLLRTMPSHSNFKTMECEGIEMLHRVLRAFLHHSPEIGYCQGMNFMVGMALLFLDEENAFWLLVAVTEVYFNSKHYNHYLTGSQADQKVAEELAMKKLPNLMETLRETGCDLSPVTFNWLMTIFIDSVPIEVALRIWDCFLLEGHPALYRFSLALLKMNEGGISLRTDMLSQMKYLKKIGRQVHDIDYLLKLAYSSFEPFPTKDVLQMMYERHFSVIQEDHTKREKEAKEYENKQKMKRRQPKTINITLAKDFGELPEDFLIECCETEDNANKVWFCCSTHNIGQLFVVDIVNRTMEPVQQEIKSRCLCLTRSKLYNTMIVGTADATLHGFDISTREEIWTLQVDDSVSSISCDVSGNIVATLASGSIAVSQQSSDSPKPASPLYLHIGRAPVVCGCICDSYFWCGCGNNIVIMDTEALDEVESIQVCPNLRHSISKLVVSDIGVWCSVRGSSVLQLFDKKTFACLMTTDVMDESGLSSEKISHLSSTRITAVLPRKKEAWVGLGNGRFLIFDVKTGPKPIEESPNSSTDDLEEKEAETEDKAAEVNGLDATTTSLPIDIATPVSPTCCHETLIKKAANKLSSFSLGDSGFVFVSKMSTSDGSLPVDDKYHLKLKQLQRISEDPVRCLTRVRYDYKQILSCVGAINDDMSIVLWSCERRENKEMWYAQTVSYAVKEQSDCQYTSLSKLKV